MCAERAARWLLWTEILRRPVPTWALTVALGLKLAGLA
jgi:hypothetical protein